MLNVVLFTLHLAKVVYYIITNDKVKVSTTVISLHYYMNSTLVSARPEHFALTYVYLDFSMCMDNFFAMHYYVLPLVLL